MDKTKSPSRAAERQPSSDATDGRQRRAALIPEIGLLGWLITALVLSVILLFFINSTCSSAEQTWILRASLIALALALIWNIAAASTGLNSAASLAKLVGEIQGGEAPIDDLNRAGGKHRALALAIRSVFLDLRQRKQAMAELNNEIGQRVVNRTQALERTLGSLRSRATRDALTGLNNRRLLDEQLPRLVRECRETTTSLALLMIDVDYFKDLNDTLGHAAGDEMLRSLGQLISSTIREKDVAFRAGGDEFVVALVGCEKTGAMNIGHHLQSLTQAMTSAYRLPRPPRLSIGISMLDELREQTADSLLRAADEALYAMKKARGSSRSAKPIHS